MRKALIIVVFTLSGCAINHNFCIGKYCYTEKTFSMLDVNRDNLLSSFEIQQSIGSMPNNNIDLDLRVRKQWDCPSVRARFDVDGDGQMSPSEYELWRAKLNQLMTSSETKEMINQIDLNSNNETVSMSGFVRQEMLLTPKFQEKIRLLGFSCTTDEVLDGAGTLFD